MGLKGMEYGQLCDLNGIAQSSLLDHRPYPDCHTLRTSGMPEGK